MPVVSGGRAGLGKHLAAAAMGIEITLPTPDILSRQQAELGQRRRELLMLGIDDDVGTVRGNHTAAPTAAADFSMRLEPVGGRLGGGQDLDVELVEKRPGPEGCSTQGRADAIEIVVGGGRLQHAVEMKYICKHVVEPQRGRCPAEKLEVFGEQTPGLTGIGSGGTLSGTDAQAREVDALAVEHSKEIVIGREEQLSRVAERLVVREPDRVGVAVGTDDGQRSHVLV